MDRVKELEQKLNVCGAMASGYVTEAGIKEEHRSEALQSVIRLRSEANKLRDENDRLKRLARYQYLTLGFYSTPFNYTEKIGYPDGSWRTNIVMDEGEEAREAAKVTYALGFTREEINMWPGPGIPRETKGKSE